MRSLKFPNIFDSNSTKVWKSSEYIKSTGQNTKLLLNTERGELFGDPYFGLKIKHYLFNQNSYVLRDQLIDTIFTQLVLFVPQLTINRKDISIVQDQEKGKLYCSFRAINKIDYQVNTYNLVLYEEKND